MKVRIGVGVGTGAAVADGGALAGLVDALEDGPFDSLWLSERLTGPAPDPLAALAFAAGRTRRLKLGTSVLVVPGRNPVVLAKAMASLDRLSGGRFLPAVGLGAPSPVEHGAFGVAREERAPWFDDALALMRRLWTEDHVTHTSERFPVSDLTLAPKPVQDPLDVWLGGQAPSELRRVGRLGDGWLPSFCTADDVAEGWARITEAAAAHGRSIDPGHLGALVTYVEGEVPERVQALIAARRPGVDPGAVVPRGLDRLRARLEEMLAVGASKLVVVPLDEPDDRTAWLARLTDAVADLQT